MRFLIAVILLFSADILYAEPVESIANSIKQEFYFPKDAKPLKVFYGGKFVQSMSYSDYQNIMLITLRNSEIIEAEKEGRVKIFLHNDPWELKENSTYTSKMDITWYTKENKELKKISIDIKITKNDKSVTAKNTDKILEIYRDVAMIGFPITSGLSILFFVLLLVL